MSNTYHISDGFRKNRITIREFEHDADIGFRYQSMAICLRSPLLAATGVQPTYTCRQYLTLGKKRAKKT